VYWWHDGVAERLITDLRSSARFATDGFNVSYLNIDDTVTLYPGAEELCSGYRSQSYKCPLPIHNGGWTAFATYRNKLDVQAPLDVWVRSPSGTKNRSTHLRRRVQPVT